MIHRLAARCSRRSCTPVPNSAQGLCSTQPQTRSQHRRQTTLSKSNHRDYAPVKKSQAKERQPSILMSQFKSNVPLELRELFYAIFIRSPDKVIDALHALQIKDMVHHITDEHLEIVVRALRPAIARDSRDQLETHRRYRSRMVFLRRWMRVNGREPTLRIWNLLFEEARIDKMYRKSSQLAKLTWKQMLRSQVKPDIYCYNSYIAAICIQPSVYDELPIRRRGETERAKTYRLKSEKRAGERANTAVLIYRDILRAEIEPTAMTIELLMLALGANKRLDAISALLLQQWNIAVPGSAKTLHEAEDGVADEYEDEGIDFDSESKPNANKAVVDQKSPLFPTQTTLHTIAMAYGLNNRTNMGLSIIQTMAKVYNINIEPKTWTEMMRWAHRDARHYRGFTPDSFILELFQLATTDHKIRPTISMYHILLLHLVKQQWNPDRFYALFDEMLTSIDTQTQSHLRPLKTQHHALAVANKILGKVIYYKTADIGKLKRRLQSKRDQHADEPTLERLQNEIERLSTRLRETRETWTGRITLFQERLANLKAAETSHIQSSHKHKTHRDRHDGHEVVGEDDNDNRGIRNVIAALRDMSKAGSEYDLLRKGQETQRTHLQRSGVEQYDDWRVPTLEEENDDVESIKSTGISKDEKKSTAQQGRSQDWVSMIFTLAMLRPK